MSERRYQTVMRLRNLADLFERDERTRADMAELGVGAEFLARQAERVRAFADRIESADG